MSVYQLVFSLPEVLDTGAKATSPSLGDGPLEDVEPHQFGL
jgi:hypothetical protein